MPWRLHRWLLLIGGLALAACAATEAPIPAPLVASLPDGPGRDVLVRECLNCHELDALDLFSGFYNQDRWRSLVITMRGNGARVDDRQVEILARYLAQHFGTGLD